MKFFDSLPQRFASLLRRYGPFFLPLLLVLCFPAGRDLARLQIIGSSLGWNWQMPWTWFYDSPDRFYNNRLLEKYPDNHHVMVREIWEAENGRSNALDEDYYYEGGSQDDARAQKLSAEAMARFPEIRWLGDLRLLCAVSGWNQWLLNQPNKHNPNVPPPPTRVASKPQLTPKMRAQIAQLLQVAKQQAQIEPDNAFPHVAKAMFLFALKRRAEALQALETASKKSLYDDHIQDITRSVIRTHELARRIAVEEKLLLFANERNLDLQSLSNMANGVAGEGKAAVKAGNHQRALKLAETLARLGALMQSGRNGVNTAQAGAAFQQSAWSIGPPVYQKSGQKVKVIGPNSQTFAAYVARHGRKDLAQQVPIWTKNYHRVQGKIGGLGQYNLNEYGGQTARKLDNTYAIGIALLCQALFVYAVWVATALLLWRGGGEPAPRRDRFFAALFLLVFAGVLATVAMWWFVSDSPGGGGNWRFDAIFGSFGVAAFLAPVFVGALVCALVTMRRHRAAFSLPARVELELNLPPFSLNLLRRGLPIMLALTLFSLVISYAIWVWAAWINLAPFDILAWLPPDRKSGFQPSLDINLTDPYFMYFVFLTLICAVSWFWKWRWGTAKSARPITQGGLRWWKETLGAYAIGLAWLYLVLALVSWPIRNSAESQFDALLKKGEIGVLVEK